MGAEEDLAAARKELEEAKAEAEKWKGLSRKHEDQSKKNSAAADELQKLKDATLSDQQKREQAEKDQAAQLADLKRRADEADARALRAEVAAAKGLTPAQAKRLTGTTKEELEADADDLLEHFKPSGKDDEPDKGNRNNNRPASRPRETLSGGTDPTSGNEVVETNPAKLAESVPRF